MIGEKIVDIALDLPMDSSHCSKYVDHRLGDRVFRICYPSENSRKLFLIKTWNTLEKEGTSIGLRPTLLQRSVEVINLHPKMMWYRVGISLSDGSLHGKSKIMFSVSTPCTLDAILKAFPLSRIYLGRLMISQRSKKKIAAINVYSSDSQTATVIEKLNTGSTSEFLSILDELRKDKTSLASFLAGILDGDGTITPYDVRVSLSEESPLMIMLSEIFDRRALKYDSKRFMVRISTNELRKREIIPEILQYMMCSKKKSTLHELAIKGNAGFRVKELRVPRKKLDDLIAKLKGDKTALSILERMHFRAHGRYMYAVVSVSSINEEHIKKNMLELLRIIGDIIEMNLEPALKKGKRELIIYNQSVVSLLRLLKKEV